MCNDNSKLNFSKLVQEKKTIFHLELKLSIISVEIKLLHSLLRHWLQSIQIVKIIIIYLEISNHTIDREQIKPKLCN